MSQLSKGDRVEAEGRRGTVISIWEHSGKKVYWIHFDDGDKGYFHEEDISLAPDALERLKERNLDNFLDFILYVDATRLLLDYAYNPYVLASTSKIDVLPYQVEAVARIVSTPTPRFLLADDVGLGKTIMAGMVLEELRERGVANKILLVVPAGLARKWKKEIAEKFGAEFVIVNSEYVRMKRGEGVRNPFEAVGNAIISMDYAKQEHVKDRVCRIAWDVVVVDEAHKLSVHSKGVGVEKTERFKLGEALAPKAKSLIFLTATPHNGDEQDFMHRLMLLNPYLATSGSLEDLMIRRIKEDVYRLERDDGKLVKKEIFPPRKSETVEVSLTPEESQFYDDLTDYIKDSYGAARQRLREESKVQSVIFALMILQRRAASSFHAAMISLENRMRRIRERAVTPEEAETLLKKLREAEEEGDEDSAEELRARLEGLTIYTGEELEHEISLLERLRDRAGDLARVDSKSKRLLTVLEKVKEGDPEAKVLVFTEYRDTLEHLQSILSGVGYTLASIHGGMGFDVREDEQRRFHTEADVMVATDAAGEGIDLQFSNIVVNYELPWNPNRLQQRIGRVHRYGQRKNVFIYNFLATGTIEEQVWDKVLEKLNTIRKRLGERVYDVLGSIVTEKEIHRLYRELTLAPQAEWEAIAKESEKRIDERLELLGRIEGLLIRDRLNPEEFREKYTIDSEKTVDEEEVKRFVDIYVKSHDGKVSQVEPQMFDIVLPLTVVDMVDTPVIRGSFTKDVAMQTGVDYIALGNRAVMAMAKDASKDTGKATALTGPKFTKGVLLFYKISAIDRLQNTQDERLISLYYDADGGEVIEVDSRCIWDCEPGDLKRKVDPSLIRNAQTKAEKAISEIVDRLLEENRGRAAERAGKKREAALMHFTSLIEEAEGRIGEYEERSIMEPHFKGLAAAERKKMEGYLREQTEALSQIEKEAEVGPAPPELVAAALVLPSTVEVVHGKRRHIDETLKRKVEDAGMRASMKKEREEGREPVDVSREFCGYDIAAYPKGAVRGERMPSAVGAERLIEVKAFKDTGVLELTSNEWDKARRWSDKYWLYVVERALTEPTLTPIRDPYRTFKDRAERVAEVTYKWVVKKWKD